MLCGALAVGSFSTQAHAQTSCEENNGDVIDLKTVTCRELLKTDDEDRSNTFVFLNGYINGTKGDLTINGPALADSVDKILDACIDSPSSTVISVFEANL